MHITTQKLIDKRKSLWMQTHDIEQDREYVRKITSLLHRNKERRMVVLRDWMDRPELMIEMLFTIVDKNQKTCPFFLNDVQWELVDIITQAKEDYLNGKRNHLKFLLLKGRQQGFTQFVTGYQLASCLLYKNFAGFTLADTAENSETIFTDKAKFPLDNLPEYVKPTKKYNNRRELHFQSEDARGLNSRLRIGTAGNEDVGRSKTVNFFHGSEVAFWKDLQAILLALGEALTQNCVAILETTANGYNGYKMLWDGGEIWQPLFFPWWKTKEYRLDFESELKHKQFLRDIKSATESDDAQSKDWVFSRIRWMMETQGTDIKQAYWYYNKWQGLHQDIKQEYPCSSKEAFMNTGQNYFSVEKLTRRLEEVKAEPNVLAQGYFEYEYGTDKFTKNKIILTDTIEWIDSSTGDTKIYIEADAHIGYIMGADTASDGTDNNIAQVIDKIGRQHATLMIAKDEDLFAEQMYCLGWYYNTALISPEVNHSTHPTKVLVERGYPNVYVRGRADTPISMGDKVQAVYGYRTDANNRPSMLGLLRELVREHADYISDIDTLNEMLTFVKNDKGKPEAESGMKDDRVISYAIAMQTKILQDEELKKPLQELEGYYTESELEDMGYSRYEIKGYTTGRLKLYREDR